MIRDDNDAFGGRGMTSPNDAFGTDAPDRDVVPQRGVLARVRRWLAVTLSRSKRP